MFSVLKFSKKYMAQRLYNLFACLIGCVVGSLLGLLLMLKSDAPFLAMLCARAFPAATCWMAGISDTKQLCKIASYAAIGWLLTVLLEPAIAQSPAQRLRHIVALPLVGYDWHLLASIVSTLLALVGAWFATIHGTPRNEDSVDLGRQFPDNNSIHQGRE
jgi:hypothetical protein